MISRIGSKPTHEQGVAVWVRATIGRVQEQIEEHVPAEVALTRVHIGMTDGRVAMQGRRVGQRELGRATKGVHPILKGDTAMIMIVRDRRGGRRRAVMQVVVVVEVVMEVVEMEVAMEVVKERTRGRTLRRAATATSRGRGSPTRAREGVMVSEGVKVSESVMVSDMKIPAAAGTGHGGGEVVIAGGG
jgi:hypothetical protein